MTMQERQHAGTDGETRVFGKHRGSVVNNFDLQGLGRVQVQVPSVYGTETINWAMPCVPYAGPGVGLFMIPPVGANVWVEFEGGDIDFPIWSGCFWGAGETPASQPTTKVLQTPAGIVTLDEGSTTPVVIETLDGNRVSIGPAGITLETAAGATIELSGPRVSVNGGALEVI